MHYVSRAFTFLKTTFTLSAYLASDSKRHVEKRLRVADGSGGKAEKALKIIYFTCHFKLNFFLKIQKVHVR